MAAASLAAWRRRAVQQARASRKETLAFIKRQHSPGARVSVRAGGDTLPATVSDLPFAR